MLDRREFFKSLAMGASAVVLLPQLVACGSKAVNADPTAGADPLAIPTRPPADWDPIAFNKARGNAGAIPESYLPSINGPDGDTQHLGKHLPYIVPVEAGQMPQGMLAIMWGDPAKGYAKHPNAPKSEENPTGHWYNSIKIRKAVDGDAEEQESAYADWPGTGEQFVVFGGGDLSEDSGKNTIYIVGLPSDVSPGDTVRIHAHCLTHGEYVDFIQV
ncbi:MAG: hypothetical protein AUK47_11795 [Deltaproteobacteria bacterium CG2_30_63_29]|nr:MAG: hypothetical protein AUK47_11795 [Deltaproteobacteria bacterium CG2_30_63_29]PJB43427.1 MAG: hypothetical protein CO108_09980 [Deltaproteobacteria bacterium CG_4_9_14_3_um_filter_63_12]